MTAKSGLPPYDAGLFFILRGNDGKHWPPRSVQAVSGWRMTKMLAYQFHMSVRQVARDVIDLAQTLEDGEHVDQRQWDDPNDAAA